MYYVRCCDSCLPLPQDVLKLSRIQVVRVCTLPSLRKGGTSILAAAPLEKLTLRGAFENPICSLGSAKSECPPGVISPRQRDKQYILTNQEDQTYDLADTGRAPCDRRDEKSKQLPTPQVGHRIGIIRSGVHARTAPRTPIFVDLGTERPIVLLPGGSQRKLGALYNLRAHPGS